jgi:hypothetical protein
MNQADRMSAIFIAESRLHGLGFSEPIIIIADKHQA